jgi:transposase
MEAAMADLFWLTDEQWAAMGPFMPRNQPGALRVDHRRVLSGIVHVLKNGGRWRDGPGEYDPHTTVYNRYSRWSRRGFWWAMLAALAEAGWIAETVALDRTMISRRPIIHHRQGALLRARRQREARAIGPSRGGPTTKVHLLADVLGRPPHAQ